MDNRRMFFALSLAVLFLLINKPTNAQSATSAHLADIQKEIEKNNQSYFDAFRKKDTSLFRSLYTPDCWIMFPNSPIFCGPNAASDYFLYMYKNTLLQDGRFITINLYGISDSIVAEVGFYQLFNSRHIQMDNGKYITLWKKSSNSWQRFRDSFNNSLSFKRSSMH